MREDVRNSIRQTIGSPKKDRSCGLQNRTIALPNYHCEIQCVQGDTFLPPWPCNLHEIHEHTAKREMNPTAAETLNQLGKYVKIFQVCNQDISIIPCAQEFPYSCICSIYRFASHLSDSPTLREIGNCSKARLVD